MTEQVTEAPTNWAIAMQRVSRVAVPAGWVVVVPMLLLAASQVFGFTSWRLLAVLQALTPYLLLPSIPLAGLAFWGKRWGLGAAATVVALVLATLSWSLFFPPGQPSAAADAPSLQIRSANVLYDNPRLDDAVSAVLTSDADVIVVTEYTERVHEAFLGSPLSDAFPYHLEATAGSVGGTGMWSRLPLEEVPSPPTKFSTVIADVTLSDESVVRLVGAHPPTPTHDFDKWSHELDDLKQYAGTGTPTVLAGDFNASWWHPGFRDLLAAGFRDAHQVRGAGFSVSWPTDRHLPAFVRLDHALVTDELVVEGVDDFDVPGSDHRGFDVTVRRAEAT